MILLIISVVGLAVITLLFIQMRLDIAREAKEDKAYAEKMAILNEQLRIARERVQIAQAKYDKSIAAYDAKYGHK